MTIRTRWRRRRRSKRLLEREFVNLPDPIVGEVRGVAHLDQLWNLLEYVSTWVRQADIKAGAVLTGSGVVATLLATQLASQTSRYQTIAQWGILAALGAAVVAFLFAGVSLVPIVKPKQGVGGSVMSFSMVAQQELKAYSDAAIKASNSCETMALELSQQVWALAIVASGKNARVRVASIALLIGVVLAAVSALIASVLVG